MTDEKKKLIDSMLFPLIFTIVIWLVKVMELLWQLDLHEFGIFPQRLSSLKGILTSPLIHGSFSHLVSNSFPVIVLGTALFYFYRDVAFKMIVFSWVVTGFWVWVMARPSYHIGASGIIYSLAAFLFASGIIRKHPRLMALSLLVVFIYGGMVWGVLPIKEGVSWESHLMGALCGFLLAYFFREHGPQRKKYSWDFEEEEEPADEGDHTSDDQNGLQDNYIKSTFVNSSTHDGEYNITYKARDQSRN